MLNYVICDDNAEHNFNTENRLNTILNKHKLPGKIALVTQEPSDVLTYAKNNNKKLNVFLMDIDFHKGQQNGLDIAQKIRKLDAKSYFVFLTGHQEYTLTSFKVKTFDFLLKPVSFEAFESCILNIYKDYERIIKSNEPSIVVKSGSIVHTIPIGEITFIEKFRQLMVIHTNNGIIRCYESLESMEEKLKNHGFFRCHKSYLINLKKVKSLSLKDNTLTMEGDEVCFVSKRNKKQVAEILKRGNELC